MGGQTALNVGIELWRNEDLQRRNIRVLGTKIDAIVATEDREIVREISMDYIMIRSRASGHGVGVSSYPLSKPLSLKSRS